MNRAAGAGSLILAILALSAGASSASAAAPFTLDPRVDEVEYPGVAVDSKGTAHVVWNEYVPFNVGDGNDIAHYCQVPRGAKSCAHKVLLSAPEDAIGKANWVLVPDDETVIVFSWRCCANDLPIDSSDAVFAWTSTDGGATFSGPTAIAGGVWPEAGIEIGPGPFAISMLSTVTTGGIEFQTAPLDGPPVTQSAGVGSQPGQPVFEKGFGIGFLDPLTPIVAGGECCAGATEDDVYFRRFSGGTNYNDVGSWGPPVPIAKGDDGRIASLPSGKKGVHLLLLQGQPGKQRYVHRRFNGENFVNPINVSETGSPHFQWFFMDRGGRLHAIWVTGDTEPLVRHRTSATGTSWGKTETLMKANFNTFNTRGDATCDGGGLAVFDNNGSGPIKAVPFGPTGPVDCEAGGGGACFESVKLGTKTVVEAQEGCFTKNKQTGKFELAGDVRVNGIDVLVNAVEGASAAAGGSVKVVVDKQARTLTTTGKVQAKVGNVVLGEEKLEWKLPDGVGKILDFAGNPAALNTANFGSELFGLDVSGYVVPEITGLAEGELTANLGLPSPFTGMVGEGSSAEAALQFSNDLGLELGGDAIDIDINNASIGIAGLGPFELDFNAGTSTLFGKGNLELPVVGTGLETEFQLVGGEFDYGKASLTFPDPGILLATNVFLTRIDFSVVASKGCTTPTKISVGGRIVVMPGVAAGSPLLDLDPFSGSYSFPLASCGKPGKFEIAATGKLISLADVNAFVNYLTSGQFNFGASLSFDLAGAASASIDTAGGVNLNNGDFYVMGEAKAELFSFRLPSAEAIASNIGIGGCGPALPIPPPINPADFLDPRGGFTYKWGGPFDIDWPSECSFNIDDFIPASLKPGAATAGRAGAAAQSATFNVGKGESAVVIEIGGHTEAPGFVLTGPNGLVIEHGGEGSDPVATEQFDVFPAPAAKLTNVRIVKPAPGAYTVADVPGEDKISSVAHATALPNPKVEAKVSGKGAKRTLSYKARKIEGQTIMFVEEGPGQVRDVIGKTKQAKGKLKFRSGPGPRGKRKVLALVFQDDAPRAELNVASYKAPGDQLPGKVRKLRLRRKGGKLVVTWRKAARAKRHVVAWRLKDGRRGSQTTKKSKFVLGEVPGIDAGLIQVAGVRADNVAGKVAKAKLKPKPKKRKKKKRR